MSTQNALALRNEAPGRFAVQQAGNKGFRPEKNIPASDDIPGLAVRAGRNTQTQA